ncbi:MAG: hypothetical protein AAGG51_01970 [Cyanobacteria bacterium P01_G01_bin.54]
MIIWKCFLNFGSIGEWYFSARHATSELAAEANRKPYFTSQEVPGLSGPSAQPDRIRPNARRTMDVKVGGRDLEQHQLRNYIALITASWDSNNQALRNKLESRYNVRGGRLEGHDYMFLPSHNSDTDDVMRRAYNIAIASVPSSDVSVNLYFVDAQGIIFKYNEPGDIARVGTQLSE